MNEDLDPRAQGEGEREEAHKDSVSEGELTAMQAELAPWLDAWQVEDARPEFREHVESCFLEGRGVCAEVDTGLEDALQGYGEVPAARDAFRERLAAQFVNGDFEVEAGAGQSPPAEADLEPVFEEGLEATEEARPTHLRPVRSPRGTGASHRRGAPRKEASPRGSWNRIGWAGAALAAAAAILLLVLGPGWGQAPAPSWRLASEGTQLAQVFLDDVPSGELTAAEFRERLQDTQRVRTGETRARLVLERRLVVELGPHSEVVLAPSPDAAEVLTFRGERGQLIFATGPEFRQDQRLVVRTDQAEVQALGTVFGVDMYDQGTCVCCAEGEVEVRSIAAGGDHRVAARERGFVMSEDGRFDLGGISQGHHEPIAELQGSLDELW